MKLWARHDCRQLRMMECRARRQTVEEGGSRAQGRRVEVVEGVEGVEAGGTRTLVEG